MLARLFARRYLFSPKSHSVIHVIAGISVFSFAMPVAAMIILLSVLNGFGDFAKEAASSFDADLTVTAREGQTFEAAQLDSTAMIDLRGVGAISYVLEQQVLLELDGSQAMATLRGVDGGYAEVFPAARGPIQGSWNVQWGDYDRLVLGREMAHSLGIRTAVDVDVTVYAVRRGSFSSLLPVDGYAVRRLPVAGIFALDLENEQKYALTSLRATQELFDHAGRVSALCIRLADEADPVQVRREVTRMAGEGFVIRSRDEMNEMFFRLVSFEKWGIFFISLLVLILASFSVVGTLVMLMIEKRDDVTTLRALGADTRLIRSIFVHEGILIGTSGAAIGAVLGISFCLLQQHYGLIRIPVDTLLLRSYPVKLRATDLLAVAVAFGVVIGVVSQLTVRSVIKRNNL